MDKVDYTATVLDIYGPLLTEHQRAVLDLFVNEDLTVSEIADTLSVSRQAVSDLITRTRNVLAEYDAKLKLFDKYRSGCEAADSILAECASQHPDIEKIAKIASAIKENL